MTDSPASAMVVDLTDIYIPANVDLLVRVKDPTGEALFVIAPVAILAANGLAYIPDVIKCRGRSQHDLFVADCGVTFVHPPHVAMNRPTQAPEDDGVTAD